MRHHSAGVRRPSPSRCHRLGLTRNRCALPRWPVAALRSPRVPAAAEADWTVPAGAARACRACASVAFGVPAHRAACRGRGGRQNASRVGRALLPPPTHPHPRTRNDVVVVDVRASACGMHSLARWSRSTASETATACARTPRMSRVWPASSATCTACTAPRHRAGSCRRGSACWCRSLPVQQHMRWRGRRLMRRRARSRHTWHGSSHAWCCETCQGQNESEVVSARAPDSSLVLRG